MMKYMLALATMVALTGLRPDQDKDYGAMAAKIKIVKDAGVEAKNDPAWKEIVERFEDRTAWMKLLEELDQQLGIVPGAGLTIDVAISSQDQGHPAVTGASLAEKGKIDISMPALLRDATRLKESPAFILKVGLLHELTHCFQRTSDGKGVAGLWPLWLTEGMAAFAADDLFLDRQFKLQNIDAVDDLTDVPEEIAAYRGLLFFKYVYHRVGREKLRTFTGNLLRETERAQKEPDPKKRVLEIHHALQGLVDESWDDFTAAEKVWARQYLRKLHK